MSVIYGGLGEPSSTRNVSVIYVGIGEPSSTRNVSVIYGGIGEPSLIKNGIYYCLADGDSNQDGRPAFCWYVEQRMELLV